MLPRAILAPHVGVLLQVSAASLLTQLPTRAPWRTAVDAPSAWAHTTQVGNADGVPGFRLVPDSALLQPSKE